MPPLFQSKARYESKFIAFSFSVIVTDMGFWLCWGLRFRNSRNTHPQWQVAVTEIWDKDPGDILIKSCPCLLLPDLAAVCSLRDVLTPALCPRRVFISGVCSTWTLKIHLLAQSAHYWSPKTSWVSQWLIRRDVNFHSNPLWCWGIWGLSPSQWNPGEYKTQQSARRGVTTQKCLSQPNTVAALEEECRGTQTLGWGDPKPWSLRLCRFGITWAVIRESPEFSADKSLEAARLEQEIVLLLPQFSLTNCSVWWKGAAFSLRREVLITLIATY